MTAPATPAPVTFIYDPFSVVDPLAVGVPVLRERLAYTDKHGAFGVLTQMLHQRTGAVWHLIAYYDDRTAADHAVMREQDTIEWFIRNEEDRADQTDVPTGAWLVVL